MSLDDIEPWVHNIQVVDENGSVVAVVGPVTQVIYGWDGVTVIGRTLPRQDGGD